MAPPPLPLPLARVRDRLEQVNTPFRFLQDAARFPRSEARYRRRLREWLRGALPFCVVYSAPKTATTALAQALEESGEWAVPKVHFLQPAHFFPGPGTAMASPRGMLKHKAIEQRTCREVFIGTDGRLANPRGDSEPLRVLSLVREPVGFNLSNFTYFGRRYWLRTVWRQAPHRDGAWLWERFERGFPHGSASVWWEDEFRASTGIDPLAEGFDAKRGWQRYRNDRVDALVLRADIPDGAKRVAVEGWLQRPIPEVRRVNENDTQAPPVLGERLREALRQHPEYVDQCLALPAARAFFTEEDRAALRQRWLRA